MKKNFISKLLFTMLLFVTAAVLSDSVAQDMAVPVNLQAALFKKIFTFDKTLQSKGNIAVTVLSADGSGDNVVSAFKEVGINASLVKGTQVPSDASVVYVMPGTPSINSQSSSKKILSISGAASFVNDGKVSIALGVEGGKPRILININQLKSEGQEVSGDLLNIAKVIQ